MIDLERGRRVLLGLLRVYLFFALIGRFVEGMGAVTCGCPSDCWCKRPGPSLFRWVFPFRHGGRDRADCA